MLLSALFISLVGLNSIDSVDARTVSEVFRSYSTPFKDVQFLYEGTFRSAEAAEADADTFQGFYAYRNDGATSIDVFGLPHGSNPGSRFIFSLLNGRLESLNASPDFLPRVRDREPDIGNGGPGSMNRSNAPERLFLAWFLDSHKDPIEYGLDPQGWEDVDGRRCLVVRVLDSPRSLLKDRENGAPFAKLWIDLERGGNPLRFEFYTNNHIRVRTDILSLVRVKLSGNRSMWFPCTGRTETYGVVIEKGKLSYKTKPDFFETHHILTDKVKFDQNLKDIFFSTKRLALVGSDDSLRVLQRELDRSAASATAKNKPDPTDAESLKRRLDTALAEADRQAGRLEASSAARAATSWIDTLSWALGAMGVSLLSYTIYRYRRQ